MPNPVRSGEVPARAEGAKGPTDGARDVLPGGAFPAVVDRTFPVFPAAKKDVLGNFPPLDMPPPPRAADTGSSEAS